MLLLYLQNFLLPTSIKWFIINEACNYWHIHICIHNSNIRFLRFCSCIVSSIFLSSVRILRERCYSQEVEKKYDLRCERMWVAGQVQLQHSLSQMVIPKNIQDGSLWKTSLTDEGDLITAGNENISVIDEELIKGWFSVLQFLYTFLYEIRVRGRGKRKLSVYTWPWVELGWKWQNNSTVLIWSYFRHDSMTCLAQEMAKSSFAKLPETFPLSFLWPLGV